MPYYFYAISVFLSAFLLFQIQPMIGKFLLPWFGGTPTVWSTILLFSQVLLTAGYAYAYWLLGRMRKLLQGSVHLILLGISLLVLLVTAVAWPSPLTPDASWRPQGDASPIWGILRVLLISIGIPFLLLAANSTLMQAWFHRDFRTPTPYRLYALSNTGSLLALLTYPIIFEPNFSLQTQAYLWTFAYLAFAIIAAYLAVRTYRWRQRDEMRESTEEQTAEATKPKVGLILLWIGLAACASVLLISMTSQITQEVAVVPFLWVVPLAVYLLTFILAFSGGYLYSRRVYLVAFFVVAIGSRMLLNIPFASIVAQVFVFMLLLFISCMLCHNELYRLRPDARYLPTFYLMVAVGGAVGGIFVTLIAALIFSTGFWELQWGLVACAILMAIVLQMERDETKRKRPRKSRRRGKQKRDLILKPVVIVLAALVLLLSGYVIFYMNSISTETEMATRNFYGVLRVWALNEEQPELRAYQLTHGKTAHGFQFEGDDLSALPTAYFTPTSGVGLTILNHPNRPDALRVGGLGLGIGIIGGYGVADDVFRFYEVNPDVIRIAEGEGDYFSFLADSEADIEVVLGDARVSLEDELLRGGSNDFDLLVIDTFSGDTIPLHLLTQEAFEIYLSHLNEGGIIAINISNRLFDLARIIYRVADEFDLDAARIEDRGDGIQSYDSEWMLLTHNEAFLQLPAIDGRSLQPPADPTSVRLWTDDFSNLFQILK